MYGFTLHKKVTFRALNRIIKSFEINLYFKWFLCLCNFLWVHTNKPKFWLIKIWLKWLIKSTSIIKMLCRLQNDYNYAYFNTVIIGDQFVGIKFFRTLANNLQYWCTHFLIPVLHSFWKSHFFWRYRLKSSCGIGKIS